MSKKSKKKVDRRMFKKEGEELQQYLHFRKRGSVVENKRGKGAYKREKKNWGDEEWVELNVPTAARPLSRNWCGKTAIAMAQRKSKNTSAVAGVSSKQFSNWKKPRYWKSKRLTTKAHFPFCNFGRAPTAQARVISIITQPQQFVNRQFAQKINNAFS